VDRLLIQNFREMTYQQHFNMLLRLVEGGGISACPGVVRALNFWDNPWFSQGHRHETHLSTFQNPPRSYARLPGSHEDPWRSRRDQRAPCQGPQAPGRLSRVASIPNGTAPRRRP